MFESTLRCCIHVSGFSSSHSPRFIIINRSTGIYLYPSPTFFTVPGWTGPFSSTHDTSVSNFSRADDSSSLGGDASKAFGAVGLISCPVGPCFT